MSGAGFVDGDNVNPCTVQSSPGTSIVGTVTCNIAGNAIAGGLFVVANGAAPGTYTITITGFTGDSGQASFTVLGPAIVITPNSGPVGTAITISGSGFASTDTSGAVSTTPSGSGLTGSCTISGGQIQSPCTFTVANTASLGTYTVTVTGNTASDSASATFRVTTTTPAITLNPASGTPLTVVSVSGGGFNTQDSSGTLSSSPVGLGAGRSARFLMDW